LAPTFTRDGIIRPLYWHAYQRLLVACDTIVAVVRAEDYRIMKDNLPSDITIIPKAKQGELPSSIRLVAGMGDAIALALPDSVWYPVGFMGQLVSAHEGTTDEVTLGLFSGGVNVLDKVTFTPEGRVQVTLHKRGKTEGKPIDGWGAAVFTPLAASWLTDDRPLADQLNNLRLGTVDSGGDYYDLGTPDRYQKHIFVGE
jgi:hypothetical protein